MADAPTLEIPAELPIRYSEVEAMAQGSIRKLLKGGSNRSTRIAAHEGDPGIRTQVFGKLASEGWTSSVGLSNREELRLAVIVAEEIGREALPVPFIASCVEAPAFAAAQTAAAPAGSIASAAPVLGELTIEDATRLAGTQRHLPHLDIADRILLTGKAPGGEIVVASVDKDASGLSLHASRTVGGDRFGTATFKDVATSGEAISEISPADYEEIVCRARIAYAGEAVGIISGALASAASYVSQRAAYGSHLIDLQVVRHQLVDIFIVSELARWATFWAADDIDDPFARLCAVTFTLQSMPRSLAQAIHMHGAMGVVYEHDARLFEYRGRAVAARLKLPRVPSSALAKHLLESEAPLSDF
jgi:alkylation response protein AidB-like acyl-CoA dehydrogenase